MKEKLTKYSTPVGELKFPWLLQPNTKFKPEGEYQVTLVLPEESAKKMLELINAAVDEHFNTIYNKASKKDRGGLKKKLPYSPEYAIVNDEEEETGRLEFKFKQAARVTSKKTGKTYDLSVAVFDKFNRKMEGNTQIWSGSTGIVNFSMRPYHVAATGMVGVKLQLNAVQVKTLVNGGNGNAESYGFEAEEMDGEDYEEQMDSPPPVGGDDEDF